LTKFFKKQYSDFKIMIGDVISLIGFLQKHWVEYSVKSALFNSDCVKIEGDNFIEVSKLVSKDSKIWFYKVKEKTEYEFIYMPVIPSLYIDYGQISGTVNPDAKIFRFVSNPLAKFTSGGEPNVISNFIVIGYKPKDLLSDRERKG